MTIHRAVSAHRHSVRMIASVINQVKANNHRRHHHRAIITQTAQEQVLVQVNNRHRPRVLITLPRVQVNYHQAVHRPQVVAMIMRAQVALMAPITVSSSMVPMLPLLLVMLSWVQPWLPSVPYCCNKPFCIGNHFNHIQASKLVFPPSFSNLSPRTIHFLPNGIRMVAFTISLLSIAIFQPLTAHSPPAASLHITHHSIQFLTRSQALHYTTIYL